MSKRVGALLHCIRISKVSLLAGLSHSSCRPPTAYSARSFSSMSATNHNAVAEVSQLVKAATEEKIEDSEQQQVSSTSSSTCNTQ